MFNKSTMVFTTNSVHFIPLFFRTFIYITVELSNLLKNLFMLFYCLLYPRTKSGILRIQHGRAAAAAAVEISFVNDNSKNILRSPFKFGMWVDMG